MKSFVVAFVLGLLAAISLHAARAASGESANPLGQSQPVCYLLDRQTTVYRTVTSADGELGAAASSVTDIVIDGRQTFDLSPRFTSATGTAVLEVVYYYLTGSTYTTKTSERLSVAAGSTREQAGSGRYMPDSPPSFDTHGANRIEVRVVSWAGSESSMTLWAGTF